MSRKSKAWIVAVGGAFLVVAISGRAEANPIKVTVPCANVTVSSDYTLNSHCNAVDGNTSTVWNSGWWPTQWIQIDLGRPMSIGKIRVQFAPNPGGQQVGSISVGPDTGHM